MATPRLPNPGSDRGTWGSILNEYLTVEHNPDGTLKKAADIADAKTKANSAVQSVNSKAPISGDVALTAADVGALTQTAADARYIAGLKQTTAPGSPALNDLWYDSTNDLWKRWNGSAWVTAVNVTSVDGQSGVVDLSTTYVGQPAVAPTNGQLLRWDSLLGEYVATNPVGAGRIAAAVNVTNVATSIPGPGAGGGIGSTIAVPGTAISVTDSGGRPVVIRFGATFNQSVTGQGSVFMALKETTSGVVDVVIHVTPLPNSAAAGLTTITLGAYEFDIGVVTTTRTFDLRVLLYCPAANNPSGSILNSAINPSWMRADAA
ncbi:MAG: hypothetical protein ABJA64_00340 [Candidatus Saccharibacteria bacterium]